MTIAEQVEIDPRLKWYQYIGPWPLRPWIVVWALGFYYLTLSSGSTQFLSGGNDGQQVLVNLLRTAVPAALVTLVLLAFSRWRPVRHNLGVYLLACATGASLGFTARWFLGSFSGTLEGVPPILLFIAMLRPFLLILIAQAIAGLVTLRLSNQVVVTEDALHQAREEQERLLLADEESRSQIAALLHDRVQAGLIASCLELQVIASRSSDSERERIDAIVERLENLRSMDVRSVARVLSPNLDDVDLLTTLEELAGQYESAMVTKITIDPKIDGLREVMGERVLLGAYRIIEQGLLNAAGHGRARHCTVDVQMLDDHMITISVTDDGVGFVKGPLREGVGSALIGTWTRSLHGTWSWREADGQGAVLEARIPVHPSQL